MTATKFNLLGIDDEVTACDCCGKKNLKCTVALSQLDADGNEVAVVRYGRDCAARALRVRATAADIEGRARAASAKAIASSFGSWPVRTVGEGYNKMTGWVSATYAAFSAQFAAPAIRANLDSATAQGWRYVGLCPMTKMRVFAAS